MQVTPTFDPTGTPPARATAGPGRRTVDAPVRMFHALFALGFLGAYLTGDSESWRALHVTLGYTLAGLLVFRVLYGLFGPHQAGLGPLWRKLGGAPAWLRSLPAAWRARSAAGLNGRQGLNLLLAASVVALLALVLPTTLSGFALFQEWGGVRAEDLLEELHEFFGNTMLLVVLVHLGLILGLSLLRRRNLALPMLTGRIEGAGPDLVRHNRGWLAALLLLAVLGFGAWQWQASPQGLLPTTDGGAHAERGHDQGDRHGQHDDDD